MSPENLSFRGHKLHKVKKKDNNTERFTEEIRFLKKIAQITFFLYSEFIKQSLKINRTILRLHTFWQFRFSYFKFKRNFSKFM